MPKKQKLPPVADPVVEEADVYSDESPMDDNQLRLAVYHLMTVLHRGGISEIHLGGLMRILGVTNESAARHDQEIVIMNDEAAEFVESLLDQYADHQDADAAEPEEVEEVEADQQADLPKATLH
jgi:hypothetical protein